MLPSNGMPASDLASHAAMDNKDGHEQRISPVPLAGPGTTRANRRLQLRKNGFRGRTVEQQTQQQQQQQQQRTITPSKPSSGSWSPTVNDLSALLDGSSDGTMHDRHEHELRRCSSSILQEVENSSLRRKGKGKVRPKMDALVSVWQDENGEAIVTPDNRESSWQLESSPACLPLDAPDLTNRKKKQLQRSTSDMVRDAMLDEKDQYIEHLESQLAAAQTQLSSLTSPTVTQARSLKMRALNNQVKALKEELADWESRYHEREQDDVDERSQLEFSLKSRIRSLEQDVEAYTLNARELQHQLEQTRNSLTAAESANMELEKRLDTFANIVALSPQKSEFGFVPFGERRGHTRRQSALPRFPTSGSLLQPSPSLNAAIMPPIGTTNIPPPSSTSSSYINSDQILEESSSSQLEVQSSPQTYTPSHSYITNEVDFAYTDSVSKRDSMLSTTSSRLSWTLPDGVNIDGPAYPSAGKTRPSRRMRRFRNSINPKTLILSTSTQMNQVPATAPVMEPHESPPAFPFPEVDQAQPSPMSFDDSPLVQGRRRAYTDTDSLTEEYLQNLSPLRGKSPPLSSSPSVNANLPRVPSPQSGTATENTDTPRDYSSLGSAAGRNLFEELRRAKTTDTETSTSDAVPRTASSTHSSFPALTRYPSNTSPSQLRQRRILHQRSISEQTALPLRSRSRTVAGLPSLYSAQSSLAGSTRSHASTSISSHTNSSSNKIVTVFSDLWHHPYLLARRCFMRGERLMLFSGSGIGKIQWWLLSFLLGPMVCRRIVSSVAQPLLLSSSNLSARAWRRQCRRNKRSVSSSSRGVDDDHELGVDVNCPCHGDGATGRLSRHSPWLWIKFSLTLAFAIGAAIKDGPGSMLDSERDWTAGHGRATGWGLSLASGRDEQKEGECTCRGGASSTFAGSSGTATLVPSSASASAPVLNNVDGETKEDKTKSKQHRKSLGAGVKTRSLADELADLGDDFEDGGDVLEDENDNDE